VRIKKRNLASAILKSKNMTLKEKEQVIDKIYIEQPNLLASVIALHQMGNSLDKIDVLLNILLVTYMALNESGIRLVKISEDLQDKEMTRYVGAVKFTEGLTSSGIENSLQQYIASHKEKYLLAYVLNEMISSGFADLEYENSKYLIMAGVNIVNCISAAKLA